MTLNTVLLEHNIHTIKGVFYHSERDISYLYPLVETLHIKLH